MYPMHTSNCSHVYLTKCKLDGLPVTLHHCICKTLTVNKNARYVGDKCAYTRTWSIQKIMRLFLQKMHNIQFQNFQFIFFKFSNASFKTNIIFCYLALKF